MRYAANEGRNGIQIGDGKGNGSRQLHGPVSVVVNEEINVLYISDYENGRIQLWRNGGIDGSVETVLDGLGRNCSSAGILYQADDLQLDALPNDAIHVLDTKNSLVWTWRFRGKYSDQRFSEVKQAMSIYHDSQGNTYLAECGGNRISKWTTKGRIAETPPNGSVRNQFNCPSAVVVAQDESIFVADTNNHQIIRWMTNARQGTCIVGCSAIRGDRADQLFYPKDVAFDWKGNLLVADTGNNRVQRFDLFIDPQCGK